jgi:hypothetical protein
MSRRRLSKPTKPTSNREEELAELLRQQEADEANLVEADRAYAIEHHSERIGLGCFRRLPSSRE